jgi:serine/threonine protein phosphatase PrpC
MFHEQEDNSMETIKKYLKEKCLDESQIKDFLETHGEEIKHFFVELWEKQFPKPAEDVPQTETPQADDSEQTVEQHENQQSEIKSNAQQEDMKKIGAGEQSDKEQAKQEALAFQIKNKQITFLNGKVNQEYCVDFDFEKLEIPEIAEVSFDKLEEIGLLYLPEEKKIKGMPTQAGDHKIEMKFKRKDWEEGKPLLAREVVFIINPDPRVLWSKNTPTPEDIEYYKLDSDKAFEKGESKIVKDEEIPRKDMVAASQRGRSHAIEGKPRDDDFALYFDSETEWYVMVVADGAGSAKYSRRGSQIACKTVKDICSKQLAKDGISEVLELAISEYQKDNSEKNRDDLYKSLHIEILAKAAWTAKNNIEKEATEKQRISKEYATTLLISICKKFNFGWFIGAFWVGDGGIGIYRKEPQELKILGVPDGGEFAGQTRFLTMPEIFRDRVRTRFEIVEDFTAVILMSDGVTDPKFETDANLNRIEKWKDLWADLNGDNEDKVKVDFSDDNEQSAEQLLKWLDFWSKGNHDDRTIAILF